MTTLHTMKGQFEFYIQEAEEQGDPTGEGSMEESPRRRSSLGTGIRDAREIFIFV